MGKNLKKNEHEMPITLQITPSILGYPVAVGMKPTLELNYTNHTKNSLELLPFKKKYSDDKTFKPTKRVKCYAKPTTRE